MTPRNLYIGAMCAMGVVLTVVSLMWPGLLTGYMSAFTVMLVASLLIDLILMRVMGASGEVVPVSIEARFGGFFAGMVIYLALTAALGLA